MGHDQRAQPGCPRGRARRAGGDDRRPARSTCWSSAAGSPASASPTTPPPAASRPGVLEQRDLASGTSSRSSKLLHGGLRYLEMLDFGLVREALQERGLQLTRLAPHLVRPVPFLYPLHRTLRAPLRRRRARALRRDGDVRQVRHGRAAAPAPVPRAGRADRPRPAHRRPRRRDPLLRLPGRRRPAGRHDRPHRRVVRRPRRHPHPGHRLPARGRPGGRRPRHRPRVGPRARGPGARRHQRRRRLDRRDPGHGRAPASSTSAPPRASTSSCRATGSARSAA